MAKLDMDSPVVAAAINAAASMIIDEVNTPIAGGKPQHGEEVITARAKAIAGAAWVILEELKRLSARK